MTGFRILVTVSRTWTRWSLMREVLTELHATYPGAVLVHGDCPQGDRQAAGIWRSLGGTDEPWPADWGRYGNSAGPVRNMAMVKSRPGLVVAFIHNNSRGATRTYHLARFEGLRCLPPYVQQDAA